MSNSPELIAAQAQVDAARTRLFGTVGEIKQRLEPRNIAEDAMDRVTTGLTSAAQRGADAARERPYAAAGVAAGIGLFLMRGWIFKRLRRRSKRHATPADAGGLNHDDTQAA
ncbi:DUF3618 domain-containing protein [Sphingomonas sp. S2-65]|uniref:DUF3618 domain-containing protein n=1 Tax=Sphingomonas sp. S2-65 TaxID=2903960 RepID=UPI001F21EE33|nr:DUF3618 domain-containing protein [Sphingomonas sp. S2-65]UYY58915.1 DUF3618 domain-containing protein [Sphingomonas sp. S2-65]